MAWHLVWTSAGILLIRILGTNYSEILSEIHIFSFNEKYKNVVLEMVAILYQPQCVNVKSTGTKPQNTITYNWVHNSLYMYQDDLCSHGAGC